MLSNHLHNGIQTAKIVWPRVPSSEEGEAAEIEFASRSHGGTGAESLDYEVIENYAYRKEQVEFALGILFYAEGTRSGTDFFVDA